ncbi:TenA family protein [Thermophagus sp. OGC60D27]|uniref:TenA family protein n=1 Tax=Thermophagus sp. OGC60D27 TaxID=3458415 RepID=UPI004037D66B
MKDKKESTRFLSIPPAGPHTAYMWNISFGMINKIFDHPFGRGLSEGTLPLECFRHYLSQDMLYIEKDARAFSILAGRSENREAFTFFLQMATDGLEIERTLHRELFPLFGVERPQKMSKACHQYTSYLTEVCLTGSYESAVAALLPCFWVYHEAGTRIRSKAVKDNPYQLWLETYADPRYGRYVARYISIVEKIMKGINQTLTEEMIQAFQKSIQYEFAFFSEAWNKK